MNSCFPDVNVWLALAVKHSHHAAALLRWEDCPDEISFCRLTQMGLLRLLTTAATMDGQPISIMEAAWWSYDQLSRDPRVRFTGEPASIEASFRSRTTLPGSAPKLWMDFYLQAFADALDATLVTFDRRLAARHSGSLLLA